MIDKHPKLLEIDDKKQWKTKSSKKIPLLLEKLIDLNLKSLKQSLIHPKAAMLAIISTNLS